MADRKGPTAAANKVALSRALGAAFLNHQVEQLEKSVSTGPVSGNWRDRRQFQGEYNNAMGRGIPKDNSKRPPQSPGFKPARKPNETMEKDRAEQKPRRRSSDDAKFERVENVKKDADVVVVDASVLVHALYQVKKWCKEGRQETVIVPLEALNTLDLLKKGTTPLAQRARAASRILEAQVGTNPRIIVQRDDAFVLWDKIDFKDYDDVKDKPQPLPPPGHGSSPEWVRRTICCARWEVENAVKTDKTEDDSRVSSDAKPKVVLAILSSSPSPTDAGEAATSETPLAPVPLPAPHGTKHEARSAGVLVGYWAAKADIEMMQVAPTLPSAALPAQGHDDERGKRTNTHIRVGSSPRGRRHSHGPSTTSAGGNGGGTGLVERPPAVMAMMEMISQPSKVVRVLARGEKLDPDT